MIWHLSTPSLWQDETATITGSKRSLNSLIALVQHTDAVHGLYYFFIHFWGQLFGYSAFGIRLPSAIAAGVATFLVYKFAVKLGLQARVAVWASIFFILLPRTSLSSVEARSTSFVTAIVALLAISFVRALENDGKDFKRWAAFGGLAAIALYLFIFSMLVLVSFGIYVAIDKRERLNSFLLSSSTAIVLATPVFALAIQEKSQIAWISRGSILNYSYQTLVTVPFGHAAPFTIALGLITFAIYKRASILLLSWAFVPGILLAAYSLIATPIFIDRYLAFCTPAFCILGAIGLTSIKLPLSMRGRFHKKVWQGAAFFVLVALSIPSYLASRSETAKGTEWSQIAGAIEANTKSGDSLLLPDNTSSEARLLDMIPLAYFSELSDLADLTLVDKPEETTGLFGARLKQFETQEPEGGDVVDVLPPGSSAASLAPKPNWLSRDFTLKLKVRFATADILIYKRK
jgi:mannosyltransferase